ncbi:BRO family protein [Clostridium merdae]|uniref:BRO family protein n=1 Tax=Clostridium merdae TaxID=1958780 RepID=UPI000A266EAA|nr:BRO family protein [Clostridium merdae]
MNLQLIKSESFGSVETDIYSNGNDMFMTIDQLAGCLEYADRKGIEKLTERNSYLKNSEFSTTVKLSVVEGGRNVTRERTIFTEDGIYEVTMLSSQPKAKEFRAWIRKILKGLRRGDAKLVSTVKENEVAARLKNAQARKAALYVKMANNDALSPKYKQVLLSYATKELNGGQAVLPLPKTKRGYSAQEIGDIFGLTANRIGRIANEHHLKVDGFGELRKDKSRSSSREVDTWVYFEEAIPEFEKILGKKSA